MSKPSSTTHSARTSAAATLLAVATIAMPAGSASAVGLEHGDATRGEYLATIMVCGDCHSGRLESGEIDPPFYLAGGTAGFEIPGMGVFWPPNLTPDVETGLGTWSAAEIAAAIRNGVRPDGRILAPIMPYAFYGRLTDTDVADLVAYLRAVAPVRHAVPAPVGATEAAAAPFYAVIVPASMP